MLSHRGFGRIDLPVIMCRKSIHCCQSNITVKAYSVYFLQILGDSGAQIELSVVFGRKAARFDEAGVFKGLYWHFWRVVDCVWVYKLLLLADRN